MELDMAFDLGEQSMIGAYADIKAGVPGGAALTRDDVAGNHVFAAVGLDSEPLARRITPVPRRTACFFVSHRPPPNSSVSLDQFLEGIISLFCRAIFGTLHFLPRLPLAAV